MTTETSTKIMKRIKNTMRELKLNSLYEIIKTENAEQKIFFIEF